MKHGISRLVLVNVLERQVSVILNFINGILLPVLVIAMLFPSALQATSLTLILVDAVLLEHRLVHFWEEVEEEDDLITIMFDNNKYQIAFLEAVISEFLHRMLKFYQY